MHRSLRSLPSFLLVVTFAVLLSAGGVALAEASAPFDLELTSQVSSTPPACSLPEPEFLSSRGATRIRAVCIANCAEYSAVTCSGASCNKTDRNCLIGQRGFCWSNSEGTKQCPACPPPECQAFAWCSSGPHVQCTGTSCEQRQGCWVNCDGNYQFCSGMDLSCEEH